MIFSAKFGGVYDFKFGFDQWSYDVRSFYVRHAKKGKG